MEDILIRQCGAKLISVGEDFRFGYERQGDVAFLQKYSSVYGYKLKVFPKKKMFGEPVSSTRIREELEKGSIEMVNQLLGHPYFIWRSMPGQSDRQDDPDAHGEPAAGAGKTSASLWRLYIGYTRSTVNI